MEKTVEKLPSINTYSRHFVAARDYPRISRAATNTTEPSLKFINGEAVAMHSSKYSNFRRGVSEEHILVFILAFQAEISNGTVRLAM